MFAGSLFFFKTILFWLLGIERKQSYIDLSKIKRVVVVRLDGIGDAVMMTPFLRELRRLLPSCWITLIVRAQVFNLIELCPYIDELLIYDWPGFKRALMFKKTYRAFKLASRHLWAKKYDLAILPRWDMDYYHGTFLTFLSGARKRVGFSMKGMRSKNQVFFGPPLFLTHVLEDNNLKHEVEHNMDVIRFIGGNIKDTSLELWLGEKDKEYAMHFLKDHKIESHDLLVGLSLGAGEPKRAWPIAGGSAELGKWLRRKYGARLVMVGGPNDEALGEEFARELGAGIINAVGQTTLRQMAALLKPCSLFVGSDAGPMHIAAALGLNIVEISCHPKSGSAWSDNSPQRFGPWKVRHTVVQPEGPRFPCVNECTAKYPHCILNIKLGDVKKAIEQYLGDYESFSIY